MVSHAADLAISTPEQPNSSVLAHSYRHGWTRLARLAGPWDGLEGSIVVFDLVRISYVQIVGSGNHARTYEVITKSKTTRPKGAARSAAPLGRRRRRRCCLRFGKDFHASEREGG